MFARNGITVSGAERLHGFLYCTCRLLDQSGPSRSAQTLGAALGARYCPPGSADADGSARLLVPKVIGLRSRLSR